MFQDEILETTLANNPRDFLSKTRLGERQERAGEAQDGHPEAQQEPSERSGVAPDHSTTHLNHLVGLGGAPSGFESEKLCVRSIRKVTPTTRTAEYSFLTPRRGITPELEFGLGSDPIVELVFGSDPWAGSLG